MKTATRLVDDFFGAMTKTLETKKKAGGMAAWLAPDALTVAGVLRWLTMPRWKRL